MNASRASSSPESTTTGRPAAASTAAQKASRLGACRIAAVATILIASTPHSRAIRTCAATSSATCATLRSGIARRPPDPSRVNARCPRISCRFPARDSATSSRVVFDPISMQAQRTRATAGSLA